jgi:DNA (cytosine-5)-methyltransferase 1
LTEIKRLEVSIPIKARKYHVDFELLQDTLRECKKANGITNRQIAEMLDRPITLVDHWFRKDKSFSIPDPDIWEGLKQLLSIETEEFDKSIMTFEERPGVYDQRNRIYFTDGIAPTLTTGSEILIIEECDNHRNSTFNNKQPNRGGSEGMEQLRVNDLFCGAGGMGLGFKQAGYRMSGAWDFDKWAVESYGNNVSPKVKQADITLMKGEEVPHADVWTFGFPCQDLSVAGKQAGMIKGETRSGLFFEVMRLLEEVTDKPKVIMAENVKGLKKYLPVLEGEYNRVGYRMYVTDQNKGLFNSKYWGVPQNRERYFVVGVRDDIEKEFIFPYQQTDYVPKLSSILEENVDEKYYIDDEKAAKIIEQARERIELKSNHACITPNRVDRRQNGRRAKPDEEPMFTLTSQDLHGIIADPSQAKREGKHRIYSETSPTLAARDYKEPRLAVVTTEDIQSVFTDKDNCAYCCDANYFKGISPGDVGNARRTHVVEERYRVRKLTPREYARLQGFPDDYKFLVSNSQLYKQFGNAVTVNVAKALAESIKEFLEG